MDLMKMATRADDAMDRARVDMARDRAIREAIDIVLDLHAEACRAREAIPVLRTTQAARRSADVRCQAISEVYARLFALRSGRAA